MNPEHLRQRVYKAQDTAMWASPLWPLNAPPLWEKELEDMARDVGITQPICFARYEDSPRESESWFEWDGEYGWVPHIYLGAGEREPIWLLHELAHALQGPDEDQPEHSRQWLANFLRLVRRYLRIYSNYGREDRLLRRCLAPLFSRRNTRQQ